MPPHSSVGLFEELPAAAPAIPSSPGELKVPAVGAGAGAGSAAGAAGQGMSSYCLRYKYGDMDIHKQLLSVVAIVAASTVSEQDQLKVGRRRHPCLLLSLLIDWLLAFLLAAAHVLGGLRAPLLWRQGRRYALEDGRFRAIKVQRAQAERGPPHCLSRAVQLSSCFRFWLQALQRKKREAEAAAALSNEPGNGGEER